ncbi:MAG: hypothetical protein ACE5FL_09735 [Myxococcota bacterium]
MIAGPLAASLLGCAGGLPGLSRPAVYTAEAPSLTESYCAWFGSSRGDVLYFGESAFWSAFRAADGRPTADLDRAGPARIGRFDLAREAFLPALDVTRKGDASGVWDVLAHPNGRVYFTTYFGSSGYVDLETNAQRRFAEAGLGLNELALGPGGSILASRYGVSRKRARGGSIVVLDPDGRVLAEYPLPAPEGMIAAPKSIAYDPLRQRIWVTTDLLRVDGAPSRRARHDAYVLDANGVVLEQIDDREIQFVAFGEDGTGYRAEVADDKLWLRIVPADPNRAHVERLRIPLEHAFAAGSDFVQDIQIAPDGRAVITRWSGWIHVVDATGAVRSLRLPSVQAGGLYYTAVLRKSRLCASYCGAVQVVCSDLAPPLWGRR